MIVENEAQVVEAVRAAASPFAIVAGGTRGGADGGAVLNVSKLSGIVNYEPEELILTVKPGTSLAEIESVLAAKGQRLGFEPQDWSAMLGTTGTATIGGAISCNANGHARVRHGAARDHLLGIRAVNGLGEAFKAGGRVVKNVTGFDIPKLVCGAYGTLCVLTELTFRVFPRPPRAVVLARRDVDPREGFALLRKVWSSPLDATALVYARGTAYVRLEGEKGPLAEKRAVLNDLVDVDAIAPGFEPGPLEIRRIHLRPTEAAATAADIAAPHWYGDWAGALLWVAGGKPVGQPLRGGTRSPLDQAVQAAFDPRSLFNPGPA
ncbi:MAG TPA: FAD-binding protein [Rhizomicrobium sp.]|jgi:glycolate oxidase FAD binding subunit|nr:FAD-binding protein [Rhizomicrobium sp.]